VRARALAVPALLIVVGCGQPAAPSLPAEIGTLAVPSGPHWFRVARTEPVAASAGEGTLRIWGLPEGTERRAIDLGDRIIDALAISPDGTIVVAGDHSGGLTAWNTASGDVLFDRRLARYPGLLAFSPDGSKLAIVVQGDPIQIVSPQGSPITRLGAAVGGTWAIAFSRDGARVATGDGDGGVRVHDARTGQVVAENRDLLMVPLAVAFTADSASVIVGSGDKVLTFIDATTGRTIRQLERTAQPVWFIDVSPDGRSMATMFMKAESMLDPDHVLVTDIESGDTRVDWLPVAFPAGGGWTSDGRLTMAVHAHDGLRLWQVH